MAPPRPQPVRRGLPAAAELRFQLVELRVDGSLVVLPVAAGKLRACFPLGFTLRVLRRGDLGLDVGHGSAPHGAAEVRHGRADHLGIQRAHNRRQCGPPDLDAARDRAQRRLRLVDVAQVGQRPEAKPTADPISMPSGPLMIPMGGPMSCDSSPPSRSESRKARDDYAGGNVASSRQWRTVARSVCFSSVGYLSKAGLRPVA